MRPHSLPAPAMLSMLGALVILALTMLQGCGTIYTPGHATGMASSKKTGIGICKNFFYFFDFGDCTIAAAARNGGIEKIATTDFARNGFPYIYTKRTTIVTGE